MPAVSSLTIMGLVGKKCVCIKINKISALKNRFVCLTPITESLESMPSLLKMERYSIKHWS